VLEAARNKPFLGICIGQQMLFEHSEEGDVPGLGVFAGHVRRFPAEKMVDAAGQQAQGAAHGLERGLAGRRAPAVGGHCRRCALLFRAQLFRRPGRRGCVVGTTDYGIPFTSAVARDNIFAIQCHPEKSALAGLAMLANFVAWKP
jgi:glutamine amidotransferase